MVEQLQPDSPAMTFDEVSMERSKNFVKALQELKNLRPQLYSAADYCEKSYLHNEQKQMVLDNLKDYAVRALVNAVDHLGTVAYKLSDLFEQQTVDASTVDLKITCLNQQILACQAYTDKECLKQHQLSSVIPVHHKHYVLPSSVNQKMQNSSPKENAERQNNGFQKRHSNSSDTASKTLSWHLSSETKSDLDGASLASNGDSDGKVSGTNNRMLQAIDGETGIPSIMWNKSQLAAGVPASNAATSPLAAIRKGMLDANKSLAPFRSFDNPAPARRQNSRPPTPTRSRSVLSSLFVKHKSVKLKY